MRSVIRRSVPAALILTLALAAGASAAGPTYYLSPSGSDSAACSQAAPCKSFSRGYTVASPGSEVVLAGGSYGSQSLSNLAVKSASDKVVFRPADGASVTVGSLTISNSDNIEVRDVKTSGWGVTNGSAHIILRRVFAGDVSYAAGYFSGSDDVQLIDSEIARVDPDDGIHMNNGGGSNTNIVIDGLYEHDLTINRDPSSHDDCIQTGDVTNLVIRNSRFVNCGTQGVFLNPYNGGVTKNVTIENNFFGTAQLGYNVLYVGDAVGVTVRNNSFVGQVYTYNSASFTGLKMINNIFAGNDSYNCGQLATKSVTFSNNASKTSCSGATNHLVNANLATQFVNTSGTSAFDLHLKAGAAAIDKGTMTNGAAGDIDGTARPVGGTPDIGADEYGSGGTPPPADTTAPDTTITSAPSSSTATTASIAFSGSDETTAAGALTYECKLDGGSYGACASPKAYTGLAVGDHTFSVRASDAAGNVDASPATATWTVSATPPPVDTTAPTTTITSSPASPTAATTASFAFSGTDETTAAGALTFECSLDGAVYAACASPQSYSGLAVGDHTFAVRAKDAAGNVDGSPATGAWTITAPAPVDTTAPDTTIASAPSGSTTATTASIQFSGSDNVTADAALTFQCKLDGGSWSTCTSPKSYTGLAAGSHTVSVRARDAAGNADGSPATATWTVTVAPPADTTAPTTSITEAPESGTTSTTGTFAFTGGDNVTADDALTFQCSLDNAAYATCTSPKSYTGLTPGAHNVRIRARDAAGNVDGSAASHTWTIATPDTTAPDTAITAGPAAIAATGDATFAFIGTDDRSAADALTFECSLDGSAYAACTSPASYNNLALLGHWFSVRAVDAAGNTDNSPATASWTVLLPSLPDIGELPAPPSTPDVPDVPEAEVPDEAPAPPAPAPVVTSVALGAPIAGQTFGRTLTMAATAIAGTSAKIKRVEFWLDGQRIVQDTAAPYRSTWTAPSRLSAGRHTLSARAVDSKGMTASTAVTVLHTTTKATRAAVKRQAAGAVAQLATTPAGDGGTDLAGATRTGDVVTATLAPCTGKAAKGGEKVRLRAVGSQLSGHRAGRLCVVGLS